MAGNLLKLMSTKPSSPPDNTAKILASIILIALALGAIAFFTIRSNTSSGTIEPEVKQMKAGARSKK